MVVIEGVLTRFRSKSAYDSDWRQNHAMRDATTEGFRQRGFPFGQLPPARANLDRNRHENRVTVTPSDVVRAGTPRQNPANLPI